MGSGAEFLLALEDWISVEVLLPFMSYHFSVDGENRGATSSFRRSDIARSH